MLGCPCSAGRPGVERPSCWRPVRLCWGYAAPTRRRKRSLRCTWSPIATATRDGSCLLRCAGNVAVPLSRRTSQCWRRTITTATCPTFSTASLMSCLRTRRSGACPRLAPAGRLPILTVAVARARPPRQLCMGGDLFLHEVVRKQSRGAKGGVPAACGGGADRVRRRGVGAGECAAREGWPLAARGSPRAHGAALGLGVARRPARRSTTKPTRVWTAW